MDKSTVTVILVIVILQPAHIFAFMLNARHVKVRMFRNRSIVLSSMADQGVRPTIDDVERISRGQAAKRRGTGSRGVPHRLNSSERIEWDLAKKKKYLLLRGTGWRKERGDSPLANVYRLYCDATEFPFISVSRGLGVDSIDAVTVDLSPLRSTKLEIITTAIIDEVKHNSDYASLISIEDKSDLNSFGWEFEKALLEEPIWRIPSFSITVFFSERSDSKKYAENIANLLVRKLKFNDSTISIEDINL